MGGHCFVVDCVFPWIEEAGCLLEKHRVEVMYRFPLIQPFWILFEWTLLSLDDMVLGLVSVF